MAAVRSVLWERRITIFFGIFAFFQICELFQAFPELRDIRFEWRLASVVAAFVLAILMAVWTLALKE
jgi:hypothetical protein